MSTKFDFNVGDTPTIVLEVKEKYLDKNGKVKIRTVDISTATSMKITFLSVDQTDRKQKDATFYTDGRDGKMKYKAGTTDFAAGSYHVQGYVKFSVTDAYNSDKHLFTVNANL